MTEKPEIVEVIAKGKTGSGKSTILDKVAELLSDEGYFHIERREEPARGGRSPMGKRARRCCN
jgi:nucleoside-triphosphatase THEP1